MSKQIILHQTENGADSRQVVDVTPCGSLAFGTDGVPMIVTRSLLGKAYAYTKPTRLMYREDFVLLPAATQAAGKPYTFDLIGGASPAVARDALGGILITTTGHTAADLAAVVGLTGTGFMPLPITTTSNLVFATTIRIPALSAATTDHLVVAGFTEIGATIDPTAEAGEGALFMYDGGSTAVVTTGLTDAQRANWILAHKVNGVDTFAATSVPVAAAVDINFIIEVGSDRKAKFYIDGVYVGTGPALTAADTFTPLVGTQVGVTHDAASTLTIREVIVDRAIA